MKVYKLSCENCNGFTEIKVENGQKFMFCPYCGQKYMINDDKVYVEINRTERKIDEARIREAEVREKIRLKELELEEKEREIKRKGSKRAYLVALGILVCGFWAETVYWFDGWAALCGIIISIGIALVTCLSRRNK